MVTKTQLYVKVTTPIPKMKSISRQELTFMVKFKVKGQGSPWSLKLLSDFKKDGHMRFLGSNSSVSELKTILGPDLQGQIRGQTTWITLEHKVTVRLEKIMVSCDSLGPTLA